MSYLLCVFLLTLLSNESADLTGTAESDAQLVLSSPQGWRQERIDFPLGFAPTLPYQGFEDIRFAPGWSDQKAEDFWSYVFVWYVDEDPQLTAATLKNQVKLYFDGLMKTQNARVEISAGSDKSNYQGHAVVKDAFFTQQQMQLNFSVKVADCPAHNKHLVVFRLSPQKPQHVVWESLHEVKVMLECTA